MSSEVVYKAGSLAHLNAALFQELARVNDFDLDNKQIDGEANRARMVCDIAAQIISNRRLLLDTAKAIEQMPGVANMKQALLE
jgi:hypothetical protein